MIDRYFQELQNLIASTPFITAASLHTERRSETIGFVRGDLTFSDASRLHFREFVRAEANQPAERYSYAYHYQSPNGHFVFRYDNTNHFPRLQNAPHHKHVGDTDVISAEAPDLASILGEISSHYLVSMI